MPFALSTIVTVASCSYGGAAEQTALPSLDLRRIVETRWSDIGDGVADEMTLSSEPPGLRLLFALRLPVGVRLMSVDQPRNVRATDSIGTDLARPDPEMPAETEFISVEPDFDEFDQHSEVMLRLGLPARSALTIDANASFEATVFSGTREIQLELGSEWKALTGEEHGLQGARVRMTDDGLELQPADAEDWIEAIETRTLNGEIVQSNGWFSDGETLTYMLDGLPEDRPLTAMFRVRTGVTRLPLLINVSRLALP